jgi:hypothetical protein
MIHVNLGNYLQTHVMVASEGRGFFPVTWGLRPKVLWQCGFWMQSAAIVGPGGNPTLGGSGSNVPPRFFFPE